MEIAIQDQVFSKIDEAVVKCGFFEVGYLDMKTLVFYPEIRKICEGNVCRNYGVTWTCPPAIGTLEECKKRIEQFDHMLLFSQKYELEDSFDFEGMMDGQLCFKELVETFDEYLKEILPHYFLFSNEKCIRCETCTYPDAPCRYPEKAKPSLEGYGFIVSELAKNANMHYTNGSNTVTYFGALLF